MKSAVLALISLLFSSHQVFGGLGIFVSESLDVSSINNIVAKDGDLQLISNEGSHYINLPWKALPHIVDWVECGSEGPAIISIDGAILVGGQEYYPPCVPTQLGKALLAFDSYANQLGTGWLPYNIYDHPLCRVDKNKLPNSIFQSLMNASNTQSEAVFYRHLTERNIGPPIPVGALLIKAEPGRGKLPLELEIQSLRSYHIQQWRMSQDFTSTTTHFAMDLPFRSLRKSLETNWNRYRISFKPMDQLSSIVEAYAILKTWRKQAPQKWETFKTQFQSRSSAYSREVAISSYPPLFPAPLESQIWTQSSFAAIGKHLETTLEAQNALDFIFFSPSSNRRLARWEQEIVKLEKTKPVLTAQKMLLFALETEENSDTAMIKARAFFSFSRTNPNWFQLRCQGLRLLQTKDTAQVFREFYATMATELFDDFFQRVPSSLPDSLTRECIEYYDYLSLLMNTSGLIPLIMDHQKSELMPLEMARKIADIHYVCAKGQIKDSQGLVKHLHFRFLKYLRDQTTPDQAFHDDIFKYRTDIAQSIGLSNWED